MNAEYRPDSDDVLHRSFGAGNRTVTLCKHLREELDNYLESAIEMGATIKLTKAVAVRCEAEDSIMPIDLSEDEKHLFLERATKLYFWLRGTRKCETCGHIARGKLVQTTPEERRRWKRELAIAVEEEKREASRFPPTQESEWVYQVMRLIFRPRGPEAPK